MPSWPILSSRSLFFPRTMGDMPEGRARLDKFDPLLAMFKVLVWSLKLYCGLRLPWHPQYYVPCR